MSILKAERIQTIEYVLLGHFLCQALYQFAKEPVKAGKRAGESG